MASLSRNAFWLNAGNLCAFDRAKSQFILLSKTWSISVAYADLQTEP